MRLIKLPPLHKAFAGAPNTKEFVALDYILIYKRIAYIGNSVNAFACNLEGLALMKDDTLEEDEEFINYMQVLDFLDNQFIPPQLWKSFTEADSIYLTAEENGETKICILNKGVESDLYYLVPGTREVKEKASKNRRNVFLTYLNQPSISVDTSYIPIFFLNAFLKVFGNIVSADQMIVISIGDDKHQLCYFKKNPHICLFLPNTTEKSDRVFIEVGIKQWIASD